MTIAFHKGNGGDVKKGATALNITEWTMQKSNRVVDVTNASSAGWAQYFPTVSEASGTAKAFWDSNNMPDATLLMDVGATVTLTLVLGDSAKAFTVPAVIENLSHQVNNQTGVVTYDFTWKCTGQVTGPA